jgi:FRG domain
MEWKKDKFIDGVLEIQASSWRGFVEYVQENLSNYRAYIYRGQREPWDLLSKMDRVLLRLQADHSRKSTRRFFKQGNVLQEFKQACRGRRGASPPRLGEANDWWALGQQYGLETPLLDWTKSPFVAGFFAFEEAKQKECLLRPRMAYAIHKGDIEKQSEKIKADKSKPKTFLGELMGVDAIEIVSPQVDDNSRLVSQGGLFTKGLRSSLEIEGWVRKHFVGADKHVTMIKISIAEQPEDREAFLRFLNRMNINYLTLFPDLDGAAKHCNMQLEIEEY